ncbi:nitroreductase family deazaflavin-dependent oxidoreductase [Actinomadura sp. LD22]|uniref:Nitroreductase family deazaflavin-dependent oxidoreductase n=1 Tax=Actinomadura physcomitrii TaxID=2650748 RepID=A0A6I4MKL1_9ACTN|nr:nitroreductase family deazaflavin-dependent oxidoreductase [Actinomadura physcomitrii]MWA04497.1 nitroreductase family deazaflavin-dependent oxidoreductase [Actinomadura physcomitrii]
MEIPKRPAPPSGLRRALFRLPVHLYRMGLGPLFGDRFLLLEHVGRASGERRQAVVEVVEHSGDDYIVCSGFGPRTDWYRNLVKTPRATVQVGRSRFAVTARPLDAEEGGELMIRYAPRHPRSAMKLLRYMGYIVDGTKDDYRRVGRELPFVRLSRVR